MNIMQRVEKHQITKNHDFWQQCDDICYKTKNLYNAANYIVRQTFIIANKLKNNKDINDEQKLFLNKINNQVDNYNLKKQNNLLKAQQNGKKLDKQFKPLNYFDSNHTYINYYFLEFLMFNVQEYRELSPKVSQQTLKLLDKDWISFFNVIKIWKNKPEKFLGRPKMPNYSQKNGRKITIFTNQACRLKNGYILFPKRFCSYSLKTKQDNLQQVRIIPKGSHYTIEVVYNKEMPQKLKNNNNFISIDLGLNNFATIVNNIGKQPIIVNGKIMKSVNQYYNKKKAEITSQLKNNNREWSNCLSKLTRKRNNKIEDSMHKISKYIISYCKQYNITNIIIGYNKEWKQNIKIGKQNNQNFINIPYYSFLQKLTYKATQIGIKIILTEESYTSGTSFIDNEEPIRQLYNKKRRIKRGLFKSNTGVLINSDVNAAYQISKKVKEFLKTFNINANKIEDIVLYPVKVNIV